MLLGESCSCNSQLYFEAQHRLERGVLTLGVGLSLVEELNEGRRVAWRLAITFDDNLTATRSIFTDIQRTSDRIPIEVSRLSKALLNTSDTIRTWMVLTRCWSRKAVRIHSTALCIQLI